MEEKGFVFTDELTKRLLRLRFANEELFKRRGHPWEEFYKIALENGFPPEITKVQLVKRWSYLFDTYRIQKRKGEVKKFKYYKLFQKHYEQCNTLDKYESWPDSWRLKLAICIIEAKDQMGNSQNDQKAMWRVVENAMRLQNLPEDCCIQDIKGLWRYILTTFRRLYRRKTKEVKRNSRPSDWPLYDTILDYYERYEADELLKLQKESYRRYQKNPRKLVDVDENSEFHWTTDITESFLQLRLQNDHMFYGKGHPWNQFTVKVLRQEHGFPNTLSPRAAGRKWQQIFADYQKAKAMNNTSWQYYNIFELYLGEGSLSLNPLLDWDDRWVINLIDARTNQDEAFRHCHHRRQTSQAWREVEKELRRNGLPIECSLLELPLLWEYLTRIYKWKSKFAKKGVLKDQWPYFEAMTKSREIINRNNSTKRIRTNNNNSIDYDDRGVADNDVDDDDIKLFDLKQQMEVEEKPNHLVENKQCRACGGVEEGVDMFQHIDKEGINVACKLLLICGIEVEKTQNLPTQICNTCLEELENAYKFRLKCQNANIQFCDYTKNIKIETNDQNDGNIAIGNYDKDMTNFDVEETDNIEEGINKIEKQIKKVKRAPKKVAKTTRKSQKTTQKKPIKRYYKICEICGFNTINLKTHIDSHNPGNVYFCDECGKSFKFRGTLVSHVATHRPGYVAKTITCEMCGKELPTTRSHRRHMAYHRNERKFACDVCDKRFNDVDVLRVHKLIHTDERPYTCSECAKTFRTSGCVNRHKRIVHKIIRNVK